MNVVAVLIAGTIGAVLGALALYYLGMWADEVIVRRFVRRYGRFFLISENDLNRTLAFFEIHGQKMVFFGV
jgi:membrane protein DedA with SNARE-associated domain